jgi:hypothetical protein
VGPHHRGADGRALPGAGGQRWDDLHHPKNVAPGPIPVRRDYYVWASPYSRIRLEPDISALEVGQALYGQKLAILEVDIANDNWLWGEIAEGQYAGRYIALEELDGFPKLLDVTPPPVIVLPPVDPKVRISSPIGIHYQLPALIDQAWKLINLCDTLHKAGKPLSAVTIVNDVWLVAQIRRVSPTTWINFRVVFSDRDPWPDFANNETGDTWFAHLWPHLSQAPEATSYQFCNEWYSKETDEHTLRAWANLYIRLIDVCKAHKVICTVGDFSVGTPEDYHMHILDPMFRKAEQEGFPVDYHMYAANNRQGHTDMSAGAEWFAMRWEKIARLYPDLLFYGGEAGNSGDGNEGHLFIPQTPSLMTQLARMIMDSEFGDRVIAAAWWEMVHPDKGDFGKDDFTPALPEIQRDLLAWKAQ